MSKVKPESRRGDDWKQWKRGWAYKSINDPKYLKDRQALFNKNGNGWWWFTIPRNQD